MPPSKPLPPAILSALGLASTGCGIFGPCLKLVACLDYATYPTGESGTRPTGGTSDTAGTTDTAAPTRDTGPGSGDTYGPCLTAPYDTYGPCLDFVVPTGDTGASTTTRTDITDREELLRRLASDGTLLDDVVQRLTDGPSKS